MAYFWEFLCCHVGVYLVFPLIWQFFLAPA